MIRSSRHPIPTCALFVTLALGRVAHPVDPTDTAATMSDGSTDASINSQTVTDSIDRAISFLETVQRPEGRWVSQTLEQEYPNAVTALTAYTLRAAGKEKSYWRVNRVAQVFKDRSRTRTVLARACTLLLWLSLDPDEYQREIEDDSKFLTWQQGKQGGWGKPVAAAKNGERLIEPVTSFLAAKAMYGAARNRVPTNFVMWNREQAVGVEHQRSGGGWAFRGPSAGKQAKAEGSASAARLATLYHAYDLRFQEAALRFNGKFMARCGKPSDDAAPLIAAIESGWAWVDQHFATDHVSGAVDVERTETPIDSLPFFLYASSEAASQAGRTHIGKHRWRSAIARALVETQQPDGSWGAIHETCFAVLALVNCREPVLFTEWRDEPASHWHRTPRDLANLTERLKSETAIRGGWQVLQAGQEEEIFASPIVLFGGHALPVLNEKQRDVLSAYLARGGTLLAVPCCSAPSVMEGFEPWLRNIAPAAVPVDLSSSDHAWWGIPEPREPMETLSGFGDVCRTAALLFREPAVCSWQQRRFNDYPDHLDVAMHALGYAMFGRENFAGPEYFVPRPTQVSAAERVLTVATMRHGGDWSIKGAAISRLSEVLGTKSKLRVVIKEPCKAKHARRSGAQVLWLTGTTFDGPKGAGLAELRSFLSGGGTIIASAACGSESFDDSFQSFAEVLAVSAAWERVPRDDQLMLGTFAGSDAVSLENMTFGKRFDSPPAPQTERPILYGLKQRGRWSVLYSPYDLASAILGESCPRCVGYLRADTMRLASNLMLYAAWGPAPDPVGENIQP